MLTKMEIQNARSDTLVLPMQDISGGYVVKEIDGLDPVNATLTSSSMAQIDGAQPQAASRSTRNITFKLGIEPDFSLNGTDTVASLRTALYDYLLPKAEIQMKFYLDNVLFAVTSGQVETCQNSMFSTDPELDVSVICYDPDFYAPAALTVDGDTVSDTTTETVHYDGTSEAGVVFTLSINRSISGFTLYNTHPDTTQQKFDVVSDLIDGDVVTITTIPGSKSVILIRDSVPSSLLYAVAPSSNWISLAKPSNTFRAFASGAAIPFTMSYTPKYGAL